MPFNPQVTLRKVRVPHGGQLVVAGDAHGHRRQVDTLLTSTGFRRQRDMLVFSGDIIDRGADSPGMAQLLGFEWTYSVIGNHEYVAAMALEGDLEASVTWAHSGGIWSDLLSNKERDQLLGALLGLPDGLLIEFNGMRIGVVHAGFPDGLDFEAGFRHVSRETLIYGSAPSTCPEDLDLLLVGHRAQVSPDPAVISLDAGVAGVVLGLDVGHGMSWRVSPESICGKRDPRIPRIPRVRSLQMA